jgi:hypothetical protein
VESHESERIEAEDAAWLDDVCRRDNFLAQLTGEELRACFAAP